MIGGVTAVGVAPVTFVWEKTILSVQEHRFSLTFSLTGGICIIGNRRRYRQNPPMSNNLNPLQFVPRVYTGD